MAIKLAERYPTRASDPSLDYPTGSFKNKSAPGAVDGTPLEKDWANDFLGFRDALLDAAEIVASGAIDTAQASQTFDALTAYIQATSPQPPAQNQTAWNSGVSAVESIISSAKLQAKLTDFRDANLQGWNQTPVNVLASRTSGVDYTNTTGKPIEVIVTQQGTAAVKTLTCVVDGVVVATGSTELNVRTVITFTVPNLSVYRVTSSGAAFISWVELR